MKSSAIHVAVILMLAGSAPGVHGQTRQNIQDVAPTPPMGWNSYDAFGSSVNESQFRSEVDFMKANLLQYGWTYAVVDYLWFNSTGGTNIRLDAEGRPLDTLAMDQYGRLLPAVDRFPSAASDEGFKPLADYVHKMGLKFGIHIMRGIPRQAFWLDTPIKGTSYTARDAADTAASDLCTWNNNMYSLDPAKPASQAYYNSIFDLYAKWGVDFVKVDDISRPYRKGEIEMIRRAIDQCGRPMVLSLSPGEAPLSEAVDLEDKANMWRISDDMWDSWKNLYHNFELLEKWSPYIGRNHWPDADMLPIGHLSVGNLSVGHDRMSRFTKDETCTLLTLWAIARSPLIMGGDMLTTPEWVISMLQNREVIAVDQQSSGNHQVFRNDSEAVWMAQDSTAGIRYLALFNLEDKAQNIDFRFDSVSGLKGPFSVRDLWKIKDAGTAEAYIRATIEAHGAVLFKLVQEHSK